VKHIKDNEQTKMLGLMNNYYALDKTNDLGNDEAGFVTKISKFLTDKKD
jgi:hypothetical protein